MQKCSNTKSGTCFAVHAVMVQIFLANFTIFKYNVLF